MTSAIDALRPIVDEARSAPPLGRPPRALGDPFPWDYRGRAGILARHAESVLDLTTGTGDLLGSVLDADRVEAYAVGADRRARHLHDAREGLHERAQLLRATPEHVPFRDHAFDLVLLRHRPYDARQLAALVARGGAILMEQIHARNWHELRTYFPRIGEREDDFERSKKVFRRYGFEFIDVRSHDRPIAFDGLEHLVYVLASSPWIVPDFSLDTDGDALLELQDALGDERGILLTRSRYVLEVRSPPPIG